MKYRIVALAVCAALSASRAESQTFKTLVQFTGTSGTASGQYPQGSLTLSGTTLYGMTEEGGANICGTIFSVGADGTNYQKLITFTGSSGTANGAFPHGNLTLSGTTLYGMTAQGGNPGPGNIFSVGADGSNYRNLVSFTGTSGTASGGFPYGSLTIDGTTLYGMTNSGGANSDGNVFSVGIGGTSYQNLLSLTGFSGTASGSTPYGSLTLGGTTLYGMTQGGGGGFGNLFSVGTDGTSYRNVVSFTGTNGLFPRGSLTISGTKLYGMTNAGGANGNGTIFSVGTDGTNFRNLRSFTGTSGSANGQGPYGSLTLSGTKLYGMTTYGGTGNGNVFGVGIDGSDYQDLYDFTGGADGGLPYGDLTLSGGTLFGMTSSNGANGDGTVFALALTTPAPEPGTMALVGAAAAMISYRWRRRRIRRSDRWRRT